MKTNPIRLLVVSIAIGFFAAVALASVGGPFGIEWHSVDSGGGTSSALQFTVTGAAGQPDIGSSSAASYAIQGGFFAGAIIDKSAANSSWSQYQ